MAFDTFGTLKTAINNWLARDDLTSYLEDFISLGELRLSRAVRTRQVVKTLSVTLSSGVASVPSDFLEVQNAFIDGNPVQPLEFKEGQWIIRNYPTRSSHGKPRFMAVVGSDFIFGPFPDSDYDLGGAYYFKPAVLSDSNDTNEYTDNFPDLLLWACLVETSPFLHNDGRLVIWQRKYEETLSGVEMTERRQLRNQMRISTN